MDTLNHKLKSLCAHSIAASMKSFDWQCSEWTLWWWRSFSSIGQIISQSAKNSTRHLILSVLCGKIGMQKYHSHSVVFFCHRVHFCMRLIYTRNMCRVVSIQPLKRCFYKQQGQPTWVPTRQETFEMPLKKLKARLQDLTSQPAESELNFTFTNPIYEERILGNAHQSHNFIITS